MRRRIGDELLYGELVVASGVRRTQTLEDRGFRMIQIRQPKNDFAARRFPALLLAHACGLPTADMHKVDRLFGPSEGSTSAKAI